MKIISDRFTPDLPLAIVAGTFAADPLDGRDGPLLAHGWHQIMDALGPMGDTMLTLREVVLAAYSLGARHALERAEADRLDVSVQEAEAGGDAGDWSAPPAPEASANEIDDETICLGDEPRPPQPVTRAPRGDRLRPMTGAEIEDLCDEDD